MVSINTLSPYFRCLPSFSLLLLVMAHLTGSGAAANRPQAFVYRGPKDDPDLSLAVGQLLESSPRKFKVQYVAPDDITDTSLSSVEIFAYPGGPDLNNAWREIEPVAEVIRSYVANGGRYLGFCLGAYLAGHSPGLGLLPAGTVVGAESDVKTAQVRNDKDTIIQVNWAFSSGPESGKTAQNRWIYYQEGNFIRGLVENQTTHVLARYSRTDDVAASLSKYGEGWVGTTGPHPEANQKWFKVANLTSPDGLQFDIGHDLIEATMTGGQNVKSLAPGSSAISSAVPSPTAKSAGNKIQNPLRRLFRH